MKRIIYFVYGLGSYLMFVLLYVYMAGFMVNLIVPKSIDSLPAGSVPLAATVDVALLLLFGLQHSIMARAGFKRIWTKVVLPAIERSTYVLLSNLALVLLIWQWRSIPLIVWDCQAERASICSWLCLQPAGYWCR
jgi:protein-S-isoprenylcysteine O-methyltransferase Ste14